MKTVDVTEADAEHRSTVHHNRLYAVVTSKGRIWCKHRVLVPFSVFGCFDKAMLLSKFQRCSSFVGLLLMMSLGGPSPVPLLAFPCCSCWAGPYLLACATRNIFFYQFFF